MQSPWQSITSLKIGMCSSVEKSVPSAAARNELVYKLAEQEMSLESIKFTCYWFLDKRHKELLGLLLEFKKFARQTARYTHESFPAELAALHEKEEHAQTFLYLAIRHRPDCILPKSFKTGTSDSGFSP